MNDQQSSNLSAVVHRVTWSEGVPTFHCDGDVTSACHSFPDCDCESWSQAHQLDHPFVAHESECWMLGWLRNIEVECTWVGGEGVNRPAEHDAEISLEWTGDYVAWDYADDDLAVQS